MVKNVKELTEKQKAVILDRFIESMEKINGNCGTIIGTVEVLERFENIAMREGFIPCPHCGRKGKVII